MLHRNEYRLIALDARTGRELWHADIGPYVPSLPETRTVLGRDGIYVYLAGRVTLIDPETGRSRWVFDAHADPERADRNKTHTAGLPHEAADGLVIAGDDSVWCVNAASGTSIWRADAKGQLVNGMATNSHDVYVVGLRGAEDYAPYSGIQAFDLRTGRRVWQYRSDVSNVEGWLYSPTRFFFFTPTTLHSIYLGANE
jgi:outer membrane protein assembly factor BamB